MARGYGNFAYVADTSFNPFQSMQEMLVPFSAYKDAYEKTEAAYDELASQSDKFKYLSETLPEDSRARQIYEGYAADLNKQANDLASHGLNINNRRALTQLKRRYQGEIGRLDEASKAYQEEMALRRQMDSKDASMLYASDNLSIDDFLDNNKPNLYNVSGTNLYVKGAEAGKNFSSRIIGSEDAGTILGGYYRDYVTTKGYNPDTLNDWQRQMLAEGFKNDVVSNIPELQDAAIAILDAEGVTENLYNNPEALRKAQQQVVRGIVDGAVYNVEHKPYKNEGVLSEAERASNRRAQQELELRGLQNGYKINKDGEWEFDEEAYMQRFAGTGIPYYNPEEWEIGPDGKVHKKSASPSTKKETPEEKTARLTGMAKYEALLALDGKALANNGGFDVEWTGNQSTNPGRDHYNYIGAVSLNNGEWHHGKIGDDVEGHGWGFLSSSNVENNWGKYSAEGISRKGKESAALKDMKVLTWEEQLQLKNNKPLWDEIEALCNASGIDPDRDDIQIIKVPNERKASGRSNYLIAVNKKN